MPEVLIVEDDQSVRSAFTHAMQHGGFRATSAENGVSALQLLAGWDFDVIVCDYKMPELSGRGFYEQIEERFPAMASRVVFVTAYSDDPKVQDFLKQTGQPVLTKPVDVHELLDAVKQVITRNAGRPSSRHYGL